MPGGRPSLLDKLDYDRIERLAELGCTDKEIAYVVGVHENTITNWKKNTKVFGALKRGKEIADKRVEESLYHRAMGYTHHEEKIFQYNGQIVRAQTLKHYPPDVTAEIFWLKNRKQKEWRDKQEVEHTGNIDIGSLINEQSGNTENPTKEVQSEET